jgi:prepilin-type N-terminal cleavage/methylation domain-containing protein
MRMSKRAQDRQRGFTLVEMLVSVLILTIVLAAVFQQINIAQVRIRAEESKVDLTQQSRAFLDGIVADLRQAGYPSPRMYTTSDANSVAGMSDNRFGMGIVYIDPAQMIFEGDMDGDGRVDSVRYQRVPLNAGGAVAEIGCPCVRRSVTPKDGVNPPWAQVYGAADTFIQNVFINDALQPLFTAFDAQGNQVNIGVVGGGLLIANAQQFEIIKGIRSIRVTINTQAAVAGRDLQTRQRAMQTMTSTVRLGNQ